MDGAIATFRAAELAYDVTGHAFQGASRRVYGAWYRPAHGEIAGTMLDQRDSVQLVGASEGAADSDAAHRLHAADHRPRTQNTQAALRNMAASAVNRYGRSHGNRNIRHPCSRPRTH